MNTSLRKSALMILLALGCCLAILGCGKDSGKGGKGPGRGSAKTVAPGPYQIDLFKADARGGTAVVILVDTSGSMRDAVRDRGGRPRPKNQIAKDALVQILQHTSKWKKDHPQANLQMGIYHFSSVVAEDLPMGDFNETKAKAALDRIPPPSGGTAIGTALEAAFKALYRSGCIRKFVVCITDGENTAGPAPDWIARQLFSRTGGEVELHFVAFDTSASQFKFLNDVNGHVVEASDGDQLHAELTKIYEKRILVEKEEP
jgi:Mg-chelatase subunit ChlD